MAQIGNFWISGSASVHPDTQTVNGSPFVSLEYLNGYLPYGWNFPVTVPTGEWYSVTDLYLQTKRVNYITQNRPDGAPSGTRSSYLILTGLVTVTDHQPHLRFEVPLLLPPGFTVTGGFANGSPETQNMIAVVAGRIYDGYPGCL